MAEAPLEYVNIKMWEEKQKSQAPQAERETSSAALQHWRGIHFLPVPWCVLVMFSWGIQIIFPLFILWACHFKIPKGFPCFAHILKCLCVYY